MAVIRSQVIFMNHEEEFGEGFLEPRMPMLRLLGSIAWNSRIRLFFFFFFLSSSIFTYTGAGGT